MFNTSSIELSAGALRNNLRFIRKLLNPGVRLCSIVKGNAYGHGLAEFARMAMNEGVDYFGVHAAEEAYQLKKHIPDLPDLFIMGAIDDQGVDWAVGEGVEFSVFDFERLHTALEAAKRHNTPAIIHIEMETGMKRTGFDFSQIPELCEILQTNRTHLTFQGLFTHFAGAENQANHFRIIAQIEAYGRARQEFAERGFNPRYHHTSCSAGLLNYPETQGNMVRIGIIQYGFWPSRETHIRFCGDTDNSPDLLKRIIRWKSHVMSVSVVSKGSFIGYGTSYLAHKRMTIAIIPIGYSHGYSRNLSNVGSVLIHGKTAQVVGTVNMNSLTVDITAIENVKKGDEVVLIGRQNGKVITVNSFSEQSNLLNYELLARLPVFIPREVTT
ncbi:MAG TPA: alanine racemase [Bacteroidia bacterium]|nr:alanine racemase [Bacteroidia bacterium]